MKLSIFDTRLPSLIMKYKAVDLHAHHPTLNVTRQPTAVSYQQNQRQIDHRFLTSSSLISSSLNRLVVSLDSNFSPKEQSTLATSERETLPVPSLSKT